MQKMLKLLFRRFLYGFSPPCEQLVGDILVLCGADRRDMVPCLRCEDPGRAATYREIEICLLLLADKTRMGLEGRCLLFMGQLRLLHDASACDAMVTDFIRRESTIFRSRTTRSECVLRSLLECITIDPILTKAKLVNLTMKQWCRQGCTQLMSMNCHASDHRMAYEEVVLQIIRMKEQHEIEEATQGMYVET